MIIPIPVHSDMMEAIATELMYEDWFHNARAKTLRATTLFGIGTSFKVDISECAVYENFSLCVQYYSNHKFVHREFDGYTFLIPVEGGWIVCKGKTESPLSKMLIVDLTSPETYFMEKCHINEFLSNEGYTYRQRTYKDYIFDRALGALSQPVSGPTEVKLDEEIPF